MLFNQSYIKPLLIIFLFISVQYPLSAKPIFSAGSDMPVVFNTIDNKYKHPFPIFDNNKFLKAYTLGIDLDFNRNDILTGINLGLQTTKYDMSLYLGYDFRPVPKKVYINPHLYPYIYEMKEGRTFLYINYEKRFGININLSRIGVVLGIKEIYTFGRYWNTKEFYKGRFIFTPACGIYWLNYETIVKLCYEYIDLKMEKAPWNSEIDWPWVSNHRIVLSFIYCLLLLFHRSTNLLRTYEVRTPS
ncbi:MAG: hypothetical protein HY738_12075 [Bacteroidia bacterium]|nr:hypothetical protein [Bacteroidia bacterium]